MARPTEEKKDKIVKLRVSEELYSELVKKGTNLSETIRKILKGESSVPQNATINEAVPEWREDLESMLWLSGITFEEFMDVIYGWVCDGTIDLTDGVQLMRPGWVDELEEACHDKGLPLGKTVDAAIKAIKRGQL